MNKKKYLENKKKKIEAVAGALCPVCGKLINNEIQIKGFEHAKKVQAKRYGNRRLCNSCLILKYFAKRR